MDTKADPGSERTPGHPLLLVAGLTLAGIAGNFLRLQIFFSIEFLFGSVFSLLALQALGLARGVLVAALVSSVTYILWNHPYAILIMTCEVLFVGLLLRGRKIELVLADAIYWLVMGMPLVFFFYHVVMGLTESNASITMLKQALNGISNSLIARLLFLATWPRVQRQLPTMREFVFNLLALFVLAPSLVLLGLQSRSDFADTDLAIRQSLGFSTERVSANLENWLDHQAAEVERLAKIAATRPLPDVQNDIDETKLVDEDFLRIGVIDEKARTVAFSPLIDELGSSNLGRSYADRPYIPILQRTLQPMFSEVVMGRVGVPAPMVTALAPIVKDGKYAGYVAGVLSLEGLNSLVSLNALSQPLEGLLYTLVDRNGRVIVTNRTDLNLMDTMTRKNGDVTDFGSGISEWIPRSRRNISISERWKRSVYISKTAIGPMSEWRLILEQRVEPFQAALFKEYTTMLAIALAILAATLPLAEWLSRRVSRSLRLLGMATKDIPDRIDSGQQMHWPHSSIRETEHLIENFKGVTDVLADQFSEIRRVNGELVHALEEVKTLQGILPICSYCKSILNDAGAWEQMEAYVSRHSGAQFSHGLCPKCLAEHYPDYVDRTSSEEQ